MVRALAALPLLAVLIAAPAAAQPGAPAEPADQLEPAPTVDDTVAAALVERGMALYRARDYRNAKRLFIEAILRSPDGAGAAAAREMIRQCNQRLGIHRPDDGTPTVIRRPPAPPSDQPLDPYGAPPPAGDQPVDPYAAAPAPTEEPIDPYAAPTADRPLDPYATDWEPARLP